MRHSHPPPPVRTVLSRGFTLAEIIIGSSIGSFVLTGVMSAFVMLGRSGQRMYHYAGMETEARRAMEEFSQDVRMASSIVLNSATSITLTVPDNYTSTGNQVTYFRRVLSGNTEGSFLRWPGNNATATATADAVLRHAALARNVVSCSFVGKTWAGTDTASGPEIRRLDLKLRLRAGTSTAGEASANVVSATYLLRNKHTN